MNPIEGLNILLKKLFMFYPNDYDPYCCYEKSARDCCCGPDDPKPNMFMRYTEE